MNIKAQVSVMTLGFIVLVAAQPALAYETDIGNFSAYGGVVSDYRYRGISRSGEDAAIQGGVDWSGYIDGLHAGVNISTVDLQGANIETNFNVGYKYAVNDIWFGLDFDVYHYPNADTQTYDYWEIGASTGYDASFLSVRGDIAYSPDFLGLGGDAIYMEASAKAPLLETGIQLDGSYGFQWIDNNQAFGAADYSNIRVGMTYNWKGLELGAHYVDTFDQGLTCGMACEDTFVASMKYTLE